MSSRIEKQFSNAATTPILITMSFECRTFAEKCMP